MTYQPWTPSDEAILREQWSKLPMKGLTTLLGRTEASIRDKAKKLGIRSTRPSFRAGSTRRGDLSPLLQDSLEAYYWLGFICADGYISPQNQLVVVQGEKDREHLERFAAFVGGQVKAYKATGGSYREAHTAYRVAIMHPQACEAIKSLLGYLPQKTVNPPTRITEMRGDRLLAFFAGFMDGDGTIQVCGRRAHLKVEVHSAWEPVLAHFTQELTGLLGRGIPQPRVTPRGYTLLQVSSKPTLSLLYSALLGLGIPLMPRKWGKLVTLGSSACPLN